MKTLGAQENWVPTKALAAHEKSWLPHEKPWVPHSGLLLARVGQSTLRNSGCPENEAVHNLPKGRLSLAKDEVDVHLVLN